MHTPPSRRRLGACSWSFRPADATVLTSELAKAGLSACQLALDPLRTGDWNPSMTRAALERAGVRVLSGMMSTAGEDYTTLESIRRTGGVRPSATWEANRAAAVRNAELARELGLRLVTLHAGFLPESRDDPERAVMIDRLRTLCDTFAEAELALGFETGQETADVLLDVLDELAHPAAGVNFDPANMLLYGMGDPIAALEALSSHVLQIHVKDALPPERAGEWGTEVAVGAGAVDWTAFFDVVRTRELDVDFIIEREAGEQRAEDIAAARELVEHQLQRIGMAS